MKLSALTSPVRIEKIIHLLRKATAHMAPPAALSLIDEYGRDPYITLVGCILSLRTQDKVSLPAALRLFKKYKTPQQMVGARLSSIEKLIYPVGFYKNKAKYLTILSKQLIDQFKGVVPRTFDELLTLQGVGPKTANLVLAQAFQIPALCVDTHVHKVSNRLGIVRTKTVEETEAELKKVIPKKYWIEYTTLIVTWGQNICVPISPKCSECVLLPLCPQVGVTRHR